jgi:EpsI family protein
MLGTALCGTAVLAMLARPASPAGEALDLASLFPSRFGPWRTDALTSAFVRPSDHQGKVLGFYDRVFERTFVDDQGYRVMLSVAYLANAFEGSALQMHEPEVCYRFAGYQVVDSQDMRLSIDGRAVAATHVVAQLPGRPEPITYWILAGGTGGGHAALRRRRIVAALRREVLDGMLVRISSVDADPARAYRVHAAFAGDMARAMAPAARDRFLGVDAAAG